MPDYHDDFFDEQKPWSRLKNRILGSYMSPYLAKVVKLRKKIILIDAFAGPGNFLDGTAGSPLIICDAAEQYAKGEYVAHFINNNLSHHNMLKKILDEKGLESAIPSFGDAIERIRQLISDLRDETLFLYIDPYGLDCEFDSLRPLLERDKNSSTEIVINLHMPISHRLGSRNAVLGDDPVDSRVQSYHDKLTRVYGGDYWIQELILHNHATAKDRERALVAQYREKLASTGYLAFTGACPIREKTKSATKYFMVFASRHPDSMLLFNDEMCKSYNSFMHDQGSQDTLFSNLTWQDWRNPNELSELVLSYIDDSKGCSRRALWLRIVQRHFMYFTSTEYHKVLRSLRSEGRIDFFAHGKDGHLVQTGRLNDNTLIMVARQKKLF